MDTFVFPMALLIPQEKRLSLTLWFLDSLYARLDECSRKITRSFGRYNVVSCVDANFLQLFLWEQFRVLAPQPREFKAPQPLLVDGVERVRSFKLAH